jgi:hypothetical protein
LNLSPFLRLNWLEESILKSLKLTRSGMKAKMVPKFLCS